MNSTGELVVCSAATFALLQGVDDAEVQSLLDKAAQIRAEIAVLEGKTVEQVEQEARDKKEQQRAVLEASQEAHLLLDSTINIFTLTPSSSFQVAWTGQTLTQGGSSHC